MLTPYSLLTTIYLLELILWFSIFYHSLLWRGQSLYLYILGFSSTGKGSQLKTDRLNKDLGQHSAHGRIIRVVLGSTRSAPPGVRHDNPSDWWHPMILCHCPCAIEWLHPIIGSQFHHCHESPVAMGASQHCA